MAITYRVRGMTCQGCANAVTNAIKAVAPLAVVTVDLDAKTVTIDGFADDAAIETAIENAGFEYGGTL